MNDFKYYTELLKKLFNKILKTNILKKVNNNIKKWELN